MQGANTAEKFKRQGFKKVFFSVTISLTKTKRGNVAVDTKLSSGSLVEPVFGANKKTTWLLLLLSV